MKANHPYRDYEALKVWKILEKALGELQNNGDLTEQTARPYIVGYLVKKLASSRVLRPECTPEEAAPREVVSKLPQLKPFRKRVRTRSAR